MAKKAKRKAPQIVADPENAEYCVINPTLGNGQRTWFKGVAGAVGEATDLLDGSRCYAGYRVPPVLFVVKVVAVIEQKAKVRTKTKAADFLTPEERREAKRRD